MLHIILEVFMFDEWEVHLYTTIPSLQWKVVEQGPKIDKFMQREDKIKVSWVAVVGVLA